MSHRIPTNSAQSSRFGDRKIFRRKIYNDDFIGTVLDAGKWVVSYPIHGNVSVSVNSGLIFTNPHTDTSNAQVNAVAQLPAKGLLVAQCNLNWSSPGSNNANAQMGLQFGDSNNVINILCRNSIVNTNYRVVITKDGVTVLDSSATGVSRGTDVKIVYDCTTNQIKFYSWNGTAWVQFLTTQNFILNKSLTANIQFSDGDATSFVGANTATFTKHFFCNFDYNTQYPI